MYISQTAAQSIVEEIGREINEHINFMAQEGYIVASTDRAGLGTLHTGTGSFRVWVMRNWMPI